jgi:hypothetical protein
MMIPNDVKSSTSSRARTLLRRDTRDCPEGKPPILVIVLETDNTPTHQPAPTHVLQTESEMVESLKVICDLCMIHFVKIISRYLFRIFHLCPVLTKQQIHVYCRVNLS